MWFIMLPIAALVAVASGIPCEDAQLKCAYRRGCGKALQNYLVGCSGVLQGSTPTYCPEVCQHSLTALVSTEEGTALMNCECSDSYCEDQKKRSEICRPDVTKILEQRIVPCQVAQWICDADAQCLTAFEYYQHYCKAMFHGKKCTPKCLNSINILRRQEKAEKLQVCICDGTEDYNCPAIQRNMKKLCFHNLHHHYNVTRPKIDKIPQVIMNSVSCNSAQTVAVLFLLLLLFWTR